MDERCHHCSGRLYTGFRYRLNVEFWREDRKLDVPENNLVKEIVFCSQRCVRRWASGRRPARRPTGVTV